MVLTNFECWAHGGSGERPILGDAVIERRNQAAVDLFNPSALQEYGDAGLVPEPPKIVSHLSSNGYYGFAPVCRTAGDEPEPPGAVQMMDVEQHAACLRNSPPPAADVATARSAGFCNGSAVRRKRTFAEEEVFQTQRRSAKRCRFDFHREPYLTDNNNGGCPSTYAPSAMFPLSMDEEELPVVNDFHAVAASAPCEQHQSSPVVGLDQRQQSVDNTAKSNFSCNNRYNDISRCMLSQMI